MPLSNLLRTSTGTYRYCGNKAGRLLRKLTYGDTGRPPSVTKGNKPWQGTAKQQRPARYAGDTHRNLHQDAGERQEDPGRT